MRCMAEITYEMNHILNCGYEIKWSFDPRSYEGKFLQVRREAWKIKAFLRNWRPECFQVSLSNC